MILLPKSAQYYSRDLLSTCYFFCKKLFFKTFSLLLLLPSYSSDSNKEHTPTRKNLLHHLNAVFRDLGVLQFTAGVMRIEVGAHLILTQRTRGTTVPPQSPRAPSLPTCTRKLGPAARVGPRTVKHRSPPDHLLAKMASPTHYLVVGRRLK